MMEQPYGISQDVSRTSGKDAQRNNILAARVIADIVKTTLGPKGMDKMLVDSSGNITVTNDGVTILENLEIEHPAAKMLVEIAKTQETEVGDGTTTVALLAGKLLEEAESLLDKKIHPTAIIRGYRLAAERAKNAVQEQAYQLTSKKTLNQLAITAMTGKNAEGHKDFLADLVVKAVDEVATGKKISIKDIALCKRRGDSISQSELVVGVVLERERAHIAMPSQVKEADILILDIPLEIKNPERNTQISISSPEQLEQFLVAEENSLRLMVDQIVASGAKVVFCQKGIDDVAQYYLAQAGIFSVRRVNKSEIERISRATGAVIVSNLHEIVKERFGFAQIVEQINHGENSFIYIRGCSNPKSVTIVARGSSPHILDEMERALIDSLGVVISAVNSGYIVAGGGAVEIELSKKLKAYAQTIGGREQLAIEAFARALESIPETLAENAGLDPIDMIARLKKEHDSGKVNAGLNLFTDTIEDTYAVGIIEPAQVKTQAISAATEVASLILRIDDVLLCKQQKPKSETENAVDGID